MRTKEEYEEGHIADALLVDFYSYNFEEQATAKLSKEFRLRLSEAKKAVAVYCRSGRRSASATAQKLVKLQTAHPQVKHIFTCLMSNETS